MEHILLKHIMEHLVAFNILANFQNGLRARSEAMQDSTNHITTDQQVLRHQSAGGPVNSILSESFHTVPHHRILQKLDSQGFTGKIHRRLKSWCTGSGQRVVIDGDNIMTS